jgi:CBS domain-containing protein
MHTRKTAKDIMSSPVIAVAPDAPVYEVAALLRDRRIGGAPVLTDGRLEGIVTESDLIHRHEIGTDSVGDPVSWWRRMRVRSSASASAYVKSHGRAARHVMTRRVHVLQPAAALGHIASLFASHRIGRAPVVCGTRVVGIVAQADLVNALADQPQVPAPACTDDEAISRMLFDELSGQPWWNARWSTLDVVGGVVIFKGVVDDEAARAASRVAAENISGVKGILDNRVLAAEVREMV